MSTTTQYDSTSEPARTVDQSGQAHCDGDRLKAIGAESSIRTDDQDMMLLGRLNEILAGKQLSALFQPIIDMRTGTIIGYEGLIRGPSDGPLHSPLILFKVARAFNMTAQVERLCLRVVQERFTALKLPGKLFLNVSPEYLIQPELEFGSALGTTDTAEINPERVIIELTENQPTYDYPLLLEAVRYYREKGFRIAIDDLGEGFSSLRLWSELRPKYVKIDMHFVQGINHDPVKLQFVRSIQEIAEKSGTTVIAEGIETQAELLLIQDLGIAFGQGYYIARPNAKPMEAVSAEVLNALTRHGVPLYPQAGGSIQKRITASRLLRTVAAVTPQSSNNDLYDRFIACPSLETIPVVDDGIPVGLVTRKRLIDHFARPYERELYGKKPCTIFMDTEPLITDKGTELQDLSQIIVDADRHHLFNGFIITDHGKYLGMGTGHDLMREITQMQISAARYANPLTLLPGNVPIDEHMHRLLQGGVQFHACYVDLDHFKPFNDKYGYRKGDDVLQMTGSILVKNCDPERDFIGHIGGDDFIILFQSEDWSSRCEAIIRNFQERISAFHSPEHIAGGGFISKDRRGLKVFHSLLAISLGVVRVEAGIYASHHQIAAAAAAAKRQAKKIPGNSLFVERRHGQNIPPSNSGPSTGREQTDIERVDCADPDLLPKISTALR